MAKMALVVEIDVPEGKVEEFVRAIITTPPIASEIKKVR